jgi:putative ABC transport system permease protein
MAALKQFVARLRALLRGRDLDREFAEEMQAHLDLATEDNIRKGMSQDEARRHAALRLGGATSLHSQHRDARGLPVIDSLLQDLKFVFRTLRADRWFSATVIGVLALGIGANTLGFTIVNAAFFRGLPFEQSAQLHMVTWLNERGRRVGATLNDLEAWRSGSRAFEALGGYDDTSASLSDARALPDEIRLTRVTTNTFAILRQPPILGRDFVAEDAAPSAEPVVMLSHHIWNTRYSLDPAVLGRTVRIDGRPATVIGVMPDGMLFPDRSDAWTPFVSAAGEIGPGTQRLEVFGRLHDGASKRSAQAEFDGIAMAQKAAHPDELKEITGARVETIPDAAIGGIGRQLFVIIMAVVMFVLVIAGANVANLLLLRSAARAREMALRSAMGATRWRLIRQLLMESLVLSLLGAAVGMVLAQGAVRAFAAAMANGGLPFWVVFSIDYVVLAYAAAVATVTAMVFGLAPAIHLSAAHSNAVIKDGGRGSIGAPRVRRFGAAMVVLELSVAIALLGGAGLMVRSFHTLYSIDLGVNIDPLITMRVDLPASQYPTAVDRRAFVAALEPRLGAIPGVQAATVTTGVPSRDGGERYVEVDGTPADAPRVMVSTVTITPSFFETIDIDVRQGRAFVDADGASGSEAAIINRRFAGQFLAGQDPIGRRLRFLRRNPAPGDPPDVWRTIVGVAPDVSHGSPSDSYINAVVYLPYREAAPASASLLLRSSLPAASIMNAARREVQALDADLPIVELRTVADILGEDRWAYRTFGTMFAAFAVIAILLSAAALYATVAHSVAQRTAEFGVRVALGANRRAILWLVLGRGLTQLAAGIAFGLAGAFLLGDVLSGMLVGVSPADPITFAAITLTLTAVSIAACLRPALRATRVDPMTALRSE